MEIWKRRTLLAVRFLIAVTAIAIIAYGFYLLARVAVSSMPAALIGIFATALAAHIFQRQREIEAAQRQRKIDAYSGFMSVIFSDLVSPIHKAREAGKQPKINSEDITDRIYEISAQIGLWAGNDVLTQYSKLLNNLIKPGSADSKRTVFDDLGDMILIFREDLGYRRRKLTARDLYPLFGVPCNFAPKPTEPKAVESELEARREPLTQSSAAPAPTRGATHARPRRQSRGGSAE